MNRIIPNNEITSFADINHIIGFRKYCSVRTQRRSLFQAVTDLVRSRPQGRFLGLPCTGVGHSSHRQGFHKK